MLIITVTSNDTIQTIADKYGLSPKKIIADNGLDKFGNLVPGQSLILLFPAEEYLVSENDETLSGVSLYTGISKRTLLRNNIFLKGSEQLQKNSTLVTRYLNKPALSKFIGGYAYGSISDTLLSTTVPYMTFLMPFTYGFAPDGTLLSPDDRRLIETAVFNGTLPLMHLSTLTNEGNFSNILANKLLNSEAAIENLYRNILDNIVTKGYYGIDVDFEFLLPEDKDKYVKFIKGLRKLMNDNGYICIVALPPKTSDNQKGLLYEGIDYMALGDAADYCFVMTYEWGYRYGPPLAIAPANSVRNVLDYAISRIQNEKLILGISNYGYDWTLPFVKGESEAISISTVKAIETANYFGAEIVFDEAAKAPYFEYTDTQGRQHIVWFEDARSYSEKVSLIKEYGLAGGFIWDLMRENPQGYVTLNALLDIL